MAVHDFRSQRLFLDVPLQNGQKVEANREQANYLLNVLRLKDEAEILLFNGKDGEWRSTIHVTGRKKCFLIPKTQTRIQPDNTGFTYCFAPLKQARLDYMVQKAVEMGAGKLQPLITQYTQVRSVSEKRMRANAIEAAEQCGILTIPEIKTPVSLEEFCTVFGSEQALVLCDEDDHNTNDLSQLKGKSLNQLSLLIGPEGGFSEADRQKISACANVAKLGLGARILRADTAAIAAMAIIQSTLGDWYASERV